MPNCQTHLPITTIIGYCLLAVLPNTAIAAEVVGSVQFKRGAVVATVKPEAERLLEIEGKVFLQDEVTAGGNAFAVIQFEDTNKLAVRPNTQVSITEYRKNQAGEAAAVQLEKGGIRANIRKIKGIKRTYRVQAGDFAVAVDEAQFDLRHCGTDCAEESKLLLAEGKPLPADAIGRVALLKGDVWAKNQDGKRRVLALTAPLFPKDTLYTALNSHLMAVFRDGGRISMESSSALEVQSMSSPGAKKPAGKMNLLTGAMRALTGKLAHESPESYSVNTPVATTGVRGTGFDLVCNGSCINEDYDGTEIGDNPSAYPDGLYSTVWKGSIYQKNDVGSFDLGEGEHQYIANRNSKPQRLKSPTERMAKMRSPRPDSAAEGEFDDFIDLNESLLTSPPRGRFMHVYGGEIVVMFNDNRPRFSVPAGYTLYVSPTGVATIIAGAPPFMSYDKACQTC